MKKYLTDVVLINKETGETKFIEKRFTEKVDAIDYLQEILNNMSEDYYSHWAKVYPIVKCQCGKEIQCVDFTNTCDKCESDYNFNGSLLASRSQWGEETREYWEECY